MRSIGPPAATSLNTLIARRPVIQASVLGSVRRRETDDGREPRAGRRGLANRLPNSAWSAAYLHPAGRAAATDQRRRAQTHDGGNGGNASSCPVAGDHPASRPSTRSFVPPDRKTR